MHSGTKEITLHTSLRKWMNLLDGGAGDARLYENPTKFGKLVTLTDVPGATAAAEVSPSGSSDNTKTIAIFNGL